MTVQDSSSVDVAQLEKDRTKLVYYHLLPLIESMPKLLQGLVHGEVHQIDSLEFR